MFDHIGGAGKITSGDFIHAPALLYDVADADIADRMAEGWAVDEWHLPRRMYQARHVRLRVPAAASVSLPIGVTWSLDLRPDVDDLVRVYEAYRQYKGFSDHLPIRQTLEMVDRDAKQAITFYQGDRLIAFTLLRIHPPALESIQFCWDYADPKLRLGFVSQDVEFAVAKALGCGYVYIGPGYETACRYKTKLPGFEWWTGEEWSTDKGLFLALLERDSRVNTIEELMTHHDDATA